MFRKQYTKQIDVVKRMCPMQFHA